MSRQFAYLLRFPRRNLEESDPQEARYALSEAKRNEFFCKSLYDFKNEFVEEEKAQAVGEHARGKEFAQMVAGHNDVFKTNEKLRERWFREADARQEETFQKNEAGREAVFLEGQTSRAVVFESYQASCAKYSEWNTAARETLLLQGRKERNDACAAIDAALVAQYNKFLKIQEESFASEEDRSDGIVKTLPDDETAAQSTALIIDDEENIQPANPSPDATPESEPFPHGRFDTPTIPSRRSSLYSTRSRSRSPVVVRRPQSPRRVIVTMSAPTGPPRRPSVSRSISPVGAINPPSPPAVIRPPSPSEVNMLFHSFPTKSASKSDPSIEAAPLPALFHSSQTSDDTGKPIGDPFHKRFASAQHERLQTFLDDEKERESSFEAAEAARDEGEPQRIKIFEQEERDRATKFRTMLDSHEDLSRGREATRTEGAIRREGVFDVAQERRSQVFGIFLLQIEKHAKAEDDLEEHLITQRKRMTESLNKRLMEQLEAAREPDLNRFKRPPEYRYPVWRESGVRAHRIPRHNGTVAYRIGRRTEVGGTGPVGYRGRSHAPRPQFSPPVGFSAGVLFRSANMQDALPVPGYDGTAQQELRQEMTFQNIQRRRRLIFERSQAQREDMFENGMQGRRQMFSANEVRRQIGFEKKQWKRKTMFEKEEAEREEDFQEAQGQQEASFRNVERRREMDFQQQEITREEAFGFLQEETADRLHKRQEELQKKCFEAENKRFSELETWGVRLMQEMPRTQTGYKSDEEEDDDE